jgi:hypothetical protein
MILVGTYLDSIQDRVSDPRLKILASIWCYLPGSLHFIEELVCLELFLYTLTSYREQTGFSSQAKCRYAHFLPEILHIQDFVYDLCSLAITNYRDCLCNPNMQNQIVLLLVMNIRYNLLHGNL